MKQAPGVETVLLKMSFEVVSSAVREETSKG